MSRKKKKKPIEEQLGRDVARALKGRPTLARYIVGAISVANAFETINNLSGDDEDGEGEPGEEEQVEGPLTCTRCSGTGRTGVRECGRCVGHGIEPPGCPPDCSHCHGRGGLFATSRPDSWVECGDCEGLGVRPVNVSRETPASG